MAVAVEVSNLFEPTEIEIARVINRARSGHLERVANDHRVFTCETGIDAPTFEIVFRIQSFIFHSEVFLNTRLKLFRGSFGCVRFSLFTETNSFNLADSLLLPEYLDIAENYDVYRIYYRGQSIDVSRQRRK